MSDQETIRVSIGVTKSIGNYESIRLDAGATFVGDPRDKEAWDEAWSIVDEQLDIKIAEVARSLGDDADGEESG